MSFKVLVSMVFAVLFLINNVCCFDVSISGGDGGSSFVDKLTINADEQDSLLVNSAVNGAAFMQEASGFGDLHKSFVANNRAGEKAWITADVVGAGYWEYYQPEIFTDSNSASVSGFGLTANEAASVKSAATAQNRLGEKASASVQVTDGSLSNYWADANAYSDGVRVYQSFDDASGQNIAVAERAADPTGSASTLTNVQEGRISRYLDYTVAAPSFMETEGFFRGAEGQKITSESLAYKAGYGSSEKMNVEGSEGQNCIISGYTSAAGVGLDFGSETGSGQSIWGSAQGNLIDLSGNSVNRERDRASSSMQIRGMEQPGYIGYYMGLTESFSGSVFAQDKFNWAEGDFIGLSAASSNARRDRVSIDGSMIGASTVESGWKSSTSNAHFAYVNNSLEGISANMTDCTASASSYATSWTTAHSNIQGGYSSIFSWAGADSSAKWLISGQEATVFGPALVQADVAAFNVVGDEVGGIFLAQFSKEYSFWYAQNASVILGVPEIRMMGAIFETSTG